MTAGGDRAALDLETALAEAPASHQADLRLWLRMLSCANLIEAEIRRRLRERFSTTLPRFDLMAQLDRMPEGLTLGEISRRMMVSNGNITALASSLVAEGLVERRIPAADRRVQRLTLTPHGRRVFEAQSVAHEGWIAELFATIPYTDRTALHRLLGVMKTGVRQALTQPPKSIHVRPEPSPGNPVPAPAAHAARRPARSARTARPVPDGTPPRATPPAEERSP